MPLARRTRRLAVPGLRRLLILLDELKEAGDNLRVEMAASQRGQVPSHFRRRQGFPIRPVRDQGIPHVNDREHSCRHWYLITFKSARIAGAVPVLMMAVGDVERLVEKRDGASIS